uniref:ADP-ribosylation factor GTPase-activating protein 3 n=1 Tax=Anthurium amnicola TaxID=1678845 RepID=A0A1D1XGY3_9ARAE
MEVVYLICAIATATLTSALHSLRLALRCLALPHGDAPAPAEDDEAPPPPPLTLYEGHVRHVRRSPCRHSFEYPVRYALVDLDRACCLPPLVLPPSFFATHLSPDDARAAAGTAGPVLLLTIPPSVGYEQNPLSVYYCYDLVPATTQEHTAAANDGERSTTITTLCLRKCIAEVTNSPWGERVSFVFDPRSDLVAKPLHVSPFMDMLGNWNIRAGEPGENLFIGISVQHPTMGNYFTATLRAKRVSTSSFSSSQLSPALFFWLMPQKVALWIYWQAVKLWWKNVSFIQHPRFSRSTYREDALLHDKEIHCSLMEERNRNGDPHLDEYRSISRADEKSETRWCVWRNADWPWS